MSLFAAAEARANRLPTQTTTKPGEWLKTFFTGGEEIGPQNAVSLSTVFNAITLISESVAQLPVAPFESSKKGGRTVKKKLKDHPTYRLIAKEPNQLMSSFDFRRLLQNWALRYDNAYAAIERKGTTPTALIPIHPTRITQEVENGSVVYEVDSKLTVKGRDMLHLIGYSDTGLKGESRIDLLSEALGNARAAEQFARNYFEKGVSVSGFIKHPGRLKDKEAIARLKESFLKSNTGKKNAGGVGVLEEGAEFIPSEVEPEKAQLNETRKVNGLTVAQIFNIPLPLLKYLDKATYNNVEQLDIQFVKYTLAPWLVNWEQELERKLLTDAEKAANNIYFKHNIAAFLRGDMASRGKFYESLAKVGAFSPNDILELEDKNGYEGGDVHVVSPGAQTVEQIQESEE
jgi:HK97 family phage portal protein